MLTITQQGWNPKYCTVPSSGCWTHGTCFPNHWQSIQSNSKTSQYKIVTWFGKHNLNQGMQGLEVVVQLCGWMIGIHFQKTRSTPWRVATPRGWTMLGPCNWSPKGVVCIPQCKSTFCNTERKGHWAYRRPLCYLYPRKSLRSSHCHRELYLRRPIQTSRKAL